MLTDETEGVSSVYLIRVSSPFVSEVARPDLRARRGLEGLLCWPAMAVSASYLTFVLEQLAGLSRVTSRRMFGGVGLYSDTTFFAVIDNDTLFFKLNGETRPRYKKRRMPPFAPMPGQSPMRGYYQVPPAVLEDSDALTTWAREAVGVGVAAGPRKMKPTAARKTKKKT